MGYRMLKMTSTKAAGENKSSTYPLGYVEDLFEPRTQLWIIFSILG
jgi:hypothetical protein